MTIAAGVPRASENPSHSFIHAACQPLGWTVRVRVDDTDPALEELLFLWQEVENRQRNDKGQEQMKEGSYRESDWGEPTFR